MHVVSSAYADCDPASLSRYTLFITSPLSVPPRSAVPRNHLLLPASGSRPLLLLTSEKLLLQLIQGSLFILHSLATGRMLRITRGHPFQHTLKCFFSNLNFFSFFFTKGAKKFGLVKEGEKHLGYLRVCDFFFLFVCLLI